MKSCEGIFPEPYSIRFDLARPALPSKLTVLHVWFRAQTFGRILFPYQEKEFLHLHTLLLWGEHQCMILYCKESGRKLTFDNLFNLKKIYTTVKDRTGVTAVLSLTLALTISLCSVYEMFIFKSILNKKNKTSLKA